MHCQYSESDLLLSSTALPRASLGINKPLQVQVSISCDEAIHRQHGASSPAFWPFLEHHDHTQIHQHRILNPPPIPVSEMRSVAFSACLIRAWQAARSFSGGLRSSLACSPQPTGRPVNLASVDAAADHFGHASGRIVEKCRGRTLSTLSARGPHAAFRKPCACRH